ncbi:MAG: hypothetical protein L6R30_20045 [Thermoanaerobaculia bacterium]|nr:hypothetical protein [Thermoanaerobaculia bacterium]
MPDLLTAVDIDTLRRVWIQDLVDGHREFGSAVIAESAQAGAVSVHLTGLGTGIIRRGTPFWIYFPGGSQERYHVAAECGITAGSAVVSISPALLSSVAQGFTVKPEPYLKSVFNMRTGRPFFSDPDLQDLALQAVETYGRRIATAADPERARYRAIRKLALDQMLGPGSVFLAELAADDERNNADGIVKRLEKILQEDREFLETASRGASSFPVFR